MLTDIQWDEVVRNTTYNGKWSTHNTSTDKVVIVTSEGSVYRYVITSSRHSALSSMKIYVEYLYQDPYCKKCGEDTDFNCPCVDAHDYKPDIHTFGTKRGDDGIVIATYVGEPLMTISAHIHSIRLIIKEILNVRYECSKSMDQLRSSAEMLIRRPPAKSAAKTK